MLEGRHTDEEIAQADVTKVVDHSGEAAEATKRRNAQHALFVSIDGPSDLLRYLLRQINISPTAYAPTGAGTRIIHWAEEQDKEKEQEMISAKPLPVS